MSAASLFTALGVLALFIFAGICILPAVCADIRRSALRGFIRDGRIDHTAVTLALLFPSLFAGVGAGALWLGRAMS